jgi:hypothetical protein
VKKATFGLDEGSTLLSAMTVQKFTIFRKLLEIPLFERLYLEIYLADSGESMLVGKLR